MLATSGRVCARWLLRFCSGIVPAAEEPMDTLSLGHHSPCHLSREVGKKRTEYHRKTPCRFLSFRRSPGSRRCPPRSKRGIVVRERTVPPDSHGPLLSALAHAWPPLPSLSSTLRRTRHCSWRWWNQLRCLPFCRQNLCLRCPRAGLRSCLLTPLHRQTRRHPRCSRIGS